jgi:hypothetical protein
MKFLLTVYAGPRRDPALGHAAFVAATRESGELIDGQVLADPSTGTLVRVRDGEPTAAHHRLPDGRAHPAAYYLVDCEDHEHAVRLAAAIPAARGGAVEVRPVMLAAGMEM